MTRVVEMFVPGHPAAQGSKRAVGRRKNGSTILIEQSKRVGPWRDQVTACARQWAGTYYGAWEPLDGPLVAFLVFWMPRPPSVPPRKRLHPTVPPDIDKLERAVFDGLTDANIWTDDARVVDVHKKKRYADDAQEPGVSIYVATLGADDE